MNLSLNSEYYIILNIDIVKTGTFTESAWYFTIKTEYYVNECLQKYFKQKLWSTHILAVTKIYILPKLADLLEALDI